MTFIKLPIKLYDQREQMQTGKGPERCALIDSFVLLNPLQIESMKPGFHDGGNDDADFIQENLICTNIRTDSGDEWFIYLPIAEVQKMIDDVNGYEIVWKSDIKRPGS